MSDKSTLLKRLQVCDFVLVEVGLFLDTHPDDQAALDFYKKHQKMRREAADMYESKYGPIIARDYMGYKNRFIWVDNKWPWEYGSEV